MLRKKLGIPSSSDRLSISLTPEVEEADVVEVVADALVVCSFVFFFKISNDLLSVISLVAVFSSNPVATTVTWILPSSNSTEFHLLDYSNLEYN